MMARVRRGGHTQHFQTECRTKYGKRLPAIVSISMVKNTLGQVVGVSKIARAMSRGQQNEERLRHIFGLSGNINAKKDVNAISSKTIIRLNRIWP
ncbi:hypothetical protein [Panacibacter microcysteis]|nr:hypothetical protein [Panacibacter microcysteis]